MQRPDRGRTAPLTAYSLLLTAYSLLLTAYCLLLTAYCSPRGIRHKNVTQVRLTVSSNENDGGFY
jgi:hypothetical protein